MSEHFLPCGPSSRGARVEKGEKPPFTLSIILISSPLSREISGIARRSAGFCGDWIWLGTNRLVSVLGRGCLGRWRRRGRRGRRPRLRRHQPALGEVPRRRLGRWNGASVVAGRSFGRYTPRDRSVPQGKRCVAFDPSWFPFLCWRWRRCACRSGPGRWAGICAEASRWRPPPPASGCAARPIAWMTRPSCAMASARSTGRSIHRIRSAAFGRRWCSWRRRSRPRSARRRRRRTGFSRPPRWRPSQGRPACFRIRVRPRLGRPSRSRSLPSRSSTSDRSIHRVGRRPVRLRRGCAPAQRIVSGSCGVERCVLAGAEG